VISLPSRLTEAEGDGTVAGRAGDALNIIVLASHPGVTLGMVIVAVENVMGDTGDAVLLDEILAPQGANADRAGTVTDPDQTGFILMIVNEVDLVEGDGVGQVVEWIGMTMI